MIDVKEQQRLLSIAKKLLDNEPALCATEHFGPRVSSGLNAEGPALLIADQSEISLFGAPEDMMLEYRMWPLGQAGDMLILSHDRSIVFEEYLREYLKISCPDILIAGSMPSERHWPLPKRCLRQAGLFDQIAHTARAAGLLSIIPYLSTGHVWNLARRISEVSEIRIALAAPPPRLARRINDKIWFANRVKHVLGRSALSPAFTVFGPAALAGHIHRLATRTERLVIKIPDSAGATGNMSLEASMFRGRSLSWIRMQLLQMLKARGWTGSFPLKIEIWETPVLVSPSAQVWIPQPHDGLPIIEGLFEQMVEGTGGTFIGAVKSRMPASWQQMMAKQATALAFLFQQLGYFGRCSMDALVIGANYRQANLHWIECNGRWGGVSLPMTLANHLLPDSDDFEIMIVQKVNLDLPARPFRVALDRLGDLLYRHGISEEGIVLLTPTGFERGVGVHFMAIAKDLDRAREFSAQALLELAGH